MVLFTSGTLNIGTGVLNLNDFVFSDAGGFAPGTYVLFDGVAPITGTLGTNLTGAVLGFSATLGFADGRNDLALTVVPEPASAAFLLSGMSVLAGVRRFRRTPRVR
jgi:hypothetical protein